MTDTTCPTCGSDCNERDELVKAEREIERLRAEVEASKQAALKVMQDFHTIDADWRKKHAALRAENEALRADAERYQSLRRGQHWSVIDGIGNALRGQSLDDLALDWLVEIEALTHTAGCLKDFVC